MQHDPLQQRTVHGENPQQDLSPLPAEEVQQVREVHHVSRPSSPPPSPRRLPLLVDRSPDWWVASFFRDNILVLDVFFEALNYETIEQKKAYEVAGLLGEFCSCFQAGS